MWHDKIPMGLEELERSGLDKSIIESVKQARIEAKDVIIGLEPEHIASFADLERRLELYLEKIRTNAKVLNTSLP